MQISFVPQRHFAITNESFIVVFATYRTDPRTPNLTFKPSFLPRSLIYKVAAVAATTLVYIDDRQKTSSV